MKKREISSLDKTEEDRKNAYKQMHSNVNEARNKKCEEKFRKSLNFQ
jgi:hypothetical protein